MTRAVEPVEKHHEKGSLPNEDGVLTQQQSTAGSVWIVESLSLPREACLVAVVCMAQFCTQSAFLGTLVLLSTIARSFHILNPARLSWLVAGYSLTIGTFILFSGRLGDLFGYKKMLIIGFSWFSLWSMISGLSVYADFELAVVARVLQGIGPAIALPNGLAILGTVYPPGHRKAMVFAFFGGVAPVGAVFGGIFASLLTLVRWPWALYVLAMWLALLAATAFFVIPELPRKSIPPSGWKSWVEELDLLGAVIGTAALVLFNFAWTQAPIDGWATPTVLVPLVLGLVLFVVFGIIELKFSKRPLLPFHAVNVDVAFVLSAMACGWACFGIWTLYVVRISQDIRHLSPLLTATWFVPCIFAGSIAAVCTGKLLGPLQIKPPVVMTMSLTAFTTGILLTAFAPTSQLYWGQTFVSMVVMPFGMDMSFPASTLILSNAVSKEHQGIGASLVNTVVNYGIALGVGFAGTVEIYTRGSSNSPADVLAGYRGALYMGIGLAGLGLAISLVFLSKQFWTSSRTAKKEEEDASASSA